MIDLFGFGVVDDVSQNAGCAQVAIVQEEPAIAIDDMRVAVKVVDAAGVKRARPADNPMNFVALM
jgi:hypothetical protein